MSSVRICNKVPDQKVGDLFYKKITHKKAVGFAENEGDEGAEMGRMGFEPMKAEPAILQTAPFDH